MVSGAVRKAQFAGSFYPENRGELNSFLKKSFTDLPNKTKEHTKALIVPHAGYIYSADVAACAFHKLSKKSGQHFVLIGPSHNFSFQNLVIDTNRLWETPLGKIKHTIPEKENKFMSYDSQPHQKEHCLEVEIPFLQFLLKNISISCLLTGYVTDIKMCAKTLLKIFPKSIFIFSSDLSHYLPYGLAEKQDKTTIDRIKNLDKDYLLREDNTACGSMGISILIEMARLKNWKAKLLKYDTSAEVSRNKSAVVGYASMTFI